MTETATRAAEIELEKPRLEISATQITTGVVASTASALLGSTLGVAGTLLGAALGAVVYSIAATLYSHSVATAKHRLLLARIEHDGDGAGAVELSGIDVDPAAPDPVADFGAAGSERGADVGTRADRAVVAVRNPGEPRRPRAPRTPKGPRLPGSSHWRSVLAGSVGSAIAFSVALLLVTGFESAKGAPLSGGTAGGLTVLGGSARTTPDVTSVSTTTNVTVLHTETSTAVVTSTAQVPGSNEPVESTVSDEAPEPVESTTASAGGPAEESSHPSGTTAPQTTVSEAPPADESSVSPVSSVEQSPLADSGAGALVDRGAGSVADRGAAGADR